VIALYLKLDADAPHAPAGGRRALGGWLRKHAVALKAPIRASRRRVESSLLCGPVVICLTYLRNRVLRETLCRADEMKKGANHGHLGSIQALLVPVPAIGHLLSGGY
jgi:hypothetical protein